MIKKSTGKYASMLVFPLLMAGLSTEAAAQTEFSVKPYSGVCSMEMNESLMACTTAGAAYSATDATATSIIGGTQPGTSLPPQLYGIDMQPSEPEYRHHTIYGNIGYGRIISSVYMAEGATGNPKNGFFWQLGYDWTAKCGIGAGLMYNGFRSSFDYYDVSCSANIMYLAPQMVIKKYYDTWALEGKIGVGYFRYSESAEGVSASTSGFGYNVHAGIEYLVSEHVGIGASLGFITGSLPEQQEVSEHNKRTGISILDIGAGVRFHF